MSPSNYFVRDLAIVFVVLIVIGFIWFFYLYMNPDLYMHVDLQYADNLLICLTLHPFCEYKKSYKQEYPELNIADIWLKYTGAQDVNLSNLGLKRKYVFEDTNSTIIVLHTYSYTDIDSPKKPNCILIVVSKNEDYYMILCYHPDKKYILSYCSHNSDDVYFMKDTKFKIPYEQTDLPKDIERLAKEIINKSVLRTKISSYTRQHR
jgi:hypothetical protein